MLPPLPGDVREERLPMTLLPCPYLGVLVELTDERQRHILLKHPDLLPEYIDYVAETLAGRVPWGYG
jgi:hypothetical protein